ncbi:serine/threonine protein phosphatase [Halobellus salinus]|uniref:Serine/threonine protein phosphatase n=1 Tax=Halobellus salinus TaxID=931585 RepID=A0A830ENP7_9EURY|nr:metallophosphoesterase family protein [Halobellus salinus]GGJ06626.1 serine/threonine protein phosphatase [Halobellus salinus]SMP14895.1 serine/threonine protein phosphatase 1 [Halobellus salinus]
MIEPPAFSPAVEPGHERVDSTAYRDIYVVGDVHGSRSALEALLASLDPGPEDLVVFVGDLVRKGPDSPGVIDLVRDDDRLVSVRGNNEQKIVRGDKDPSWLRHGDRAYFESLPIVVSFDDAIVVHGGIDPERALTTHAAEELLTMRAPHGSGYDGPFWYEDYDGPYRVFFGHTVHERPVERDHAIGLDTGCVYGGQLTAYDDRRGEFVTVDPATTHQSRSAEKIAPVP